MKEIEPIRLMYSDRAWFEIDADGKDLGMIAHAFPNPTVNEKKHEFIVEAVNSSLKKDAELAQLREKLALSKDALKIALRVIDSLHEQQAMEDNSFLTQREIVEQALAIIDGKEEK